MIHALDKMTHLTVVSCQLDAVPLTATHFRASVGLQQSGAAHLTKF